MATRLKTHLGGVGFKSKGGYRWKPRTRCGRFVDFTHIILPSSSYSPTCLVCKKIAKKLSEIT